MYEIFFLDIVKSCPKTRKTHYCKGLLEFLRYTCLLYNLVRICFYLERGSNYSYLEMKENGEMFLLYINIDSNCLNINI